MPSFSLNSLAIPSSPHEGFAAAIFRINSWQSLGRRGLPVGFDFQRQNSRNPFAVPSDEGIGYDYQRTASVEPSNPSDIKQRGGVLGAVWLNLPLLVERQLLPKEQILPRQSTARPHCEKASCPNPS